MYKILGILVLLLSIVFSIGVYKKIDTLNNGKKITAYVIDIPRPCKNAYKSFKPYFKFRYNDSIFTKNIIGDYCRTLEIGDEITLITKSGSSFFVYPNENFKSEVVVVVLLYVFGFFLFLKKQKK